jgi:hypothetical protein
MIRDITRCSSYVNRRFGGKYHLHLQGGKSADEETSVLSIWLGRISRQSGYQMEVIPFPKRRFIYELHSAESQKVATFITTAERTPNRTLR